jgi:hypothetical protein
MASGRKSGGVAKSAIGETESLKAKSSGVAAKSIGELANGENGGEA